MALRAAPRAVARRSDTRAGLCSAPRDVPRTDPGEATLSDRDPADRKTGPWLLLAGAAVGLALAAWGLLEERAERAALSPETAATVGERRIRRIDYERVLAGVEGDLRNPVDDAMRRRVLDRMIDEELLVQRALDLGLAAVDRRVRGELTSGLIDSIVNEADTEEPSDRAVAAHYEENRDFFTRPGRLRARTLFFSTRRDDGDPRGTAESRARQALAALRAGQEVEAVEQAWADTQVSTLPDALLPPAKVRDYVGPTILSTLMALETGAWAGPVASGGGLHLVQVVDRDAPVVPALEEIEPLVRQDLKRRRGDAALRAYLDDLRSETPVEVNESVFERGEPDPGA